MMVDCSNGRPNGGPHREVVGWQGETYRKEYCRPLIQIRAFYFLSHQVQPGSPLASTFVPTSSANSAKSADSTSSSSATSIKLLHPLRFLRLRIQLLSLLHELRPILELQRGRFQACCLSV